MGQMTMLRWLGWLLVVPCMAWAQCESAVRGDDVGLQVPEGFVASLYAGDELAHDIFSMTIDGQGDVVVAGQKYIKTLLDTDGDGRADQAKLFSPLPASGAHGMCFVGRDLVFTGDNMLGVLRDANGDGAADGPPEKWTTLRHPEHGANGVVQGPDGWLYVICGNDAGLGVEHVQLPSSPVKEPRCGGVLRVSTDGRQMEVLAHGFRNPYDLDFSATGELLTVDADGERDHHLPWYAPTRLFDIAIGGEHGWLLAGWQRSWNRPQSYFDNVERACEFGRGSPTGMVVYRHSAFPPKYQGAALQACWSLGRVYVCPLQRRGAVLKSQPEIFIQTAAGVGFAPVDLAVGRSGELYVAIGGRGTRGSVFKIQYTGKQRQPLPPVEALDLVLSAPQPLSAWSRAEWVPQARRLSVERFVAALMDTRRESAQRVRAVEILVELFGGVPLGAARVVLERNRKRASSEDVAARVLWALACHPQPEALELIAAATYAPQPLVQRAAFEALATVAAHYPPGKDLSVQWSAAQESPDRRVRAAAIRAAVVCGAVKALPAAARLWVQPGGRRDEAFFAAALRLFSQPRHGVASQLEAVRLMQLGLGDLRVQPGEYEVYSGYAGNAVQEVAESVRQRIVRELAPKFPTPDAELNRELARLLGMLNAQSSELLEAIAAQWTRESDPRDDIHYLIVASRLPGERSAGTTARAAAMLAGLHEKMEQRKYYPSRNWPLRVGEAFSELCRRDAALGAALLADAQFGRPEHSLFVTRLPEAQQAAAARKLLQAALAAGDNEEAWTSELIAALAVLPEADVLPCVREKWSDVGLRDAILPLLARRPLPEDRPRFLEGLASPQPDVVLAAARALAKLDPPHKEHAPEEFAAVIKALRSVSGVKTLAEQRQAITQLLQGWTGENFNGGSGDGSTAWQPWQAWFVQLYPQHGGLLGGTGVDDLAQWQARLPKIDFSGGDPVRGQKFFQQKSCHRCHVGASRLGPDLVGIAGRLSREDLLVAIVDPSRAISPTYRTTTIVTRAGKVYQGILIYESPDATLVQISPDVTVRIGGDELAAQQPGTQSLMPVGLLQDATDQDVADLFAYLKTLNK